MPESEMRQLKTLAAPRGISLQEAVHQALESWTMSVTSAPPEPLDNLQGSLAGVDIEALRREERKAELARAAVRKLLEEADRKERRLIMSIVNLGEVFYLTAKARDIAYGERVLSGLRARIHTVSAADEVAMMAANLKARHAISYAGAFAAVTAIRSKAPLLTGDPEFLSLAHGASPLNLQWIGAPEMIGDRFHLRYSAIADALPNRKNRQPYPRGRPPYPPLYA